MKKFWFWTVVVLVAAAFGLGYWPERSRRLAVEGERRVLEAELARTLERERFRAVQARLFDVGDAVSTDGFEQAQQLASRFFDEAAAEALRSGNAAYRASLEQVVSLRDELTAALARRDPTAAAALLRQLRSLLQMAPAVRPAAGTPASPGASAPSSPSPAPE